MVLLAETGARGAELFDDSKDEKRDGITSGDVDLERHVLSVFGKSCDREEVSLPKAARDVLKCHRKYVDPPTDKWPVFPTGHFQSKRGVLELFQSRSGFLPHRDARAVLDRRVDPVPALPLKDVPMTASPERLELATRLTGEVPFYLKE